MNPNAGLTPSLTIVDEISDPRCDAVAYAIDPDGNRVTLTCDRTHGHQWIISGPDTNMAGERSKSSRRLNDWRHYDWANDCMWYRSGTTIAADWRRPDTPGRP